MPSESADDAPAWIVDENLRLLVTFRFAEKWHIGRVVDGDDEIRPDNKLTFPAGGGGSGVRAGGGIVIAPIHLQGLPPDEVAKIIRHRAEDMAMLAEAITIANIQFREALDSIAPDTDAEAEGNPS